jgi:type IV pilus assembly protein PilM
MELFSIKSYIGVDIGSSGIKMVELKKENDYVRLLTYGFSDNFDSKVGEEWQGMDIKKTARIINKIRNKAGIVSRVAVAALPTYSVFSSIINISNVSPKDLASAIQWEAKKVIPLPLEEMVIEWKKIEDTISGTQSPANMKVLLTGAPRVLVKKYIEIFKEAKLNLLCLETETFSLIRSLFGNDQATAMIVEMGTNTSDIIVVSKGLPVINRSIDAGGITITRALSSSLNIGMERSEQFKYDLGVSFTSEREEVVPKIIIDALSPLINEIKYVINLFQSKNNEKVEKIVLSGGSCLLPNFVNYLSKLLDIKVIIGDPWARISYPLDLKPVLEEIAPRISVAIGLAMREIE